MQLELPDAMKTDNLAMLPELTEGILLDFLKQRYSKDQIYVCVYVKLDLCRILSTLYQST